MLEDAAVRAAVVYSLFSSHKALGIDERAWLEDVLTLTAYKFRFFLTL